MTPILGNELLRRRSQMIAEGFQCVSGDFRGIGHSDILWYNGKTGQVVMWLLTFLEDGTIEVEDQPILDADGNPIAVAFQL